MCPHERHQTTLEHLEELRRRLLASLGCVAILSFASYFFSDSILSLLLYPLKDEASTLYFFSPPEAFLVKLKISVLSGLILSLPLIITEAWLFIAPGLYKNERRTIILCVLASLLLFVFGAVFCFFLVIPFALRFLLQFGGPHLKPLLSVGKYISFVSVLLISFGVAFNLPVFVAGAVRLGVLRAETLKKKWRYIIVGVFIAAAILTPPDVVTQILLAGPLLLLYEVCILIAYWMERKK